ncbi:putative uncharacterized protein DDB_G0282133 [Bacillus rossius redtenbacheri]|uniref:putative uncharacterized protein DDB_G0282133 n=1 Tax=Bacillus rossius redtenbacheri TaxID=93214 RepID=UPI002FDD0E43
MGRAKQTGLSRRRKKKTSATTVSKATEESSVRDTGNARRRLRGAVSPGKRESSEPSAASVPAAQERRSPRKVRRRAAASENASPASKGAEKSPGPRKSLPPGSPEQSDENQRISLRLNPRRVVRSRNASSEIERVESSARPQRTYQTRQMKQVNGAQKSHSPRKTSLRSSTKENAYSFSGLDQESTVQKLQDLSTHSSSYNHSKLEPILTQNTSIINFHKFTKPKKSLQPFLDDRSVLSSGSIPRDPLWWKSLDETANFSGEAGQDGRNLRVAGGKNLSVRKNTRNSTARKSLLLKALGARNKQNILFVDKTSQNVSFTESISDASKSSYIEDSIISKTSANKLVFKRLRLKRVIQDDLFDAAFDDTGDTDVDQGTRSIPRENKTLPHIDDSDVQGDSDDQGDDVTPPIKKAVPKRRQNKKAVNGSLLEAAFENLNSTNANKKQSNPRHLKKHLGIGESEEGPAVSVDLDSEDSNLSDAVVTRKRFQKPRRTQVVDDNFDAAFETTGDNTIDNISSHTRGSLKAGTGSNKTSRDKQLSAKFNVSERGGVSNSALQHESKSETEISWDSKLNSGTTPVQRLIPKKSQGSMHSENDFFQEGFENSSSTTYNKLSMITERSSRNIKQSFNVDVLGSENIEAITPSKKQPGFKKKQQKRKKRDGEFDEAFDNANNSGGNKRSASVQQNGEHVTSSTISDSEDKVTPARKRTLRKLQNKKINEDEFETVLQKSNNTSASIRITKKYFHNTKHSLNGNEEDTKATTPKQQSSFMKQHQNRNSGNNFNESFKNNNAGVSRKLLQSVQRNKEQNTVDTTSDSEDESVATARRHVLRKSRNKKVNEDEFEAAFEKSNDTSPRLRITEKSFHNTRHSLNGNEVDTDAINVVTFPKQQSSFMKQHQNSNSSNQFNESFKNNNAGVSRKLLQSLQRNKEQNTVDTTSDSEDESVATARRHVLRKSRNKKVNEDEFEAAFEKSNDTSTRLRITEKSFHNTRHSLNGNEVDTDAINVVTSPKQQSSFMKQHQNSKSSNQFNESFKNNNAGVSRKLLQSVQRNKEQNTVDTTSDSEDESVATARRHVLRKSRNKKVNEDEFEAAFEKLNDTSARLRINRHSLNGNEEDTEAINVVTSSKQQSSFMKQHQNSNSGNHFNKTVTNSNSDVSRNLLQSVQRKKKQNTVDTTSDSEDESVATARKHVLRKSRNKKVNEDEFEAAFEKSNDTSARLRINRHSLNGNEVDTEAINVVTSPKQQSSFMKQHQNINSSNQFNESFKNNNAGVSRKLLQSLQRNKEQNTVDTNSDSEDESVATARRHVLRKSRNKKVNEDEFEAAFEKSNDTSTRLRITEKSFHNTRHSLNGNEVDTDAINVVTSPKQQSSFMKQHQNSKSSNQFNESFKNNNAGVSRKLLQSVQRNKEQNTVDTTSDSEDESVATARKHVLRKSRNKKVNEDEFEAAFEKLNDTSARLRINRHSLNGNEEDTEAINVVTSSKQQSSFMKQQQNSNSGNYFNKTVKNSNSDVSRNLLQSVQRKKKQNTVDTTSDSEDESVATARKHVLRKSRNKKVNEDEFEAAFEKSNLSTSVRITDKSPHNTKHSAKDDVLEDCSAVTPSKKLPAFKKQQKKKGIEDQFDKVSDNSNSLSHSVKENKKQVTESTTSDSEVMTLARRQVLRKSQNKKLPDLFEAAFKKSVSTSRDRIFNNTKIVGQSPHKQKNSLNEESDFGDVSSIATSIQKSSFIKQQKKKRSLDEFHETLENANTSIVNKLQDSEDSVATANDSEDKATPAKRRVLLKSRNKLLNVDDLFEAAFGKSSNFTNVVPANEIVMLDKSTGRPELSSNDNIPVSKSAFKQQQLDGISGVSLSDAVVGSPDTSDVNKKHSDLSPGGGVTNNSRDHDVTPAKRHVINNSGNDMLHVTLEVSQNATNEDYDVYMAGVSSNKRKFASNADVNSSRSRKSSSPSRKKHAFKKQDSEDMRENNELIGSLGSPSNVVTTDKEMQNLTEPGQPVSTNLSGISFHGSVPKQVKFVEVSQFPEGRAVSLRSSAQMCDGEFPVDDARASAASSGARPSEGGGRALNTGSSGAERESPAEQTLSEAGAKTTSRSSVPATRISHSGNEAGSSNARETINDRDAGFSRKVGENVAAQRQSKITDFIEAYKKTREEKENELKRTRETALDSDFPLPSLRKTVARKPAKEIDPDFLVNGKMIRARRLKKPAPWFSKKLYDVLIRACEIKYGALRHRRKAEEFAGELHRLVKEVLKKKKDYEGIVEVIKKKLFKIGVIETLDDFYHFIRDFLPEEFRYKVIPCRLAFGRMSGIPVPEGVSIWARLSFP